MNTIDTTNQEGFIFPASFSQQRLWFLDQLEPQSSLYIIPQAFRLQGTLDVEALRQAFETLVARHESLRTTFSVVDEHPVQCIAEQGSIALQVIDLMHLPETEREGEAQRLAAEEFRKPFDLAQGPLLRVSLLRLGATEHLLLLTLHHIIADGWSLGILVQEMATLYDAFSKGISPSLPDLPIQYADFAVWQKEWLQGEVLAAQVSYWKEQLKGNLPLIALPTDHPRPAIQTYRGKRTTRVLSKQLQEALKALSQREEATLFMTLLAAFKVLLYRYAGQDDIIVGSPIANRNRLETEGLIGFFLNTLVLRTDLSGDPTFRELLVRVREVALGAYAHQDLPFEKLVEELEVPRDLSYNPLFQVMFILQNAPLQPLQLAGLTVNPLEAATGTAKFEVTLELVEGPEGLTSAVEYNTDLFEPDTIERLLGHFQTLLQGIVADPDARLSELPLLTEHERHQLLVEWNNTTTDYPRDTCIHELFEAQVARTPDAVALAFEGMQLTYNELNNRANQLARYLRTLGVGPEVLVGICMERSLEMVVGLLGILKAGGAYVPLDPAYPKERVAFMMEKARMRVVVTQQDIAALLPQHTGRVVCMDDARMQAEMQHLPARNLLSEDHKSGPSNLAYVIFTSGSTGRPKGVAIEHHSAVSLIRWARDVFTSEELAGVLASTSISFDLSVFELFVTLSCGGKVILAKNVLHLSNLADANDITLINTVPSAINELLRLHALPPSVRVVNLAGEPLSQSIVQQLYDLPAIQKVYDLYGPSETTTYSTFTLRRPDGVETIGRPIANTRVYLLDDHRQLVPVGIPGELYIGGEGVARGYLHQSEATTQRFIPDPFSTLLNARLYKTGDLARYLPDGPIVFLGRLDNQVKIRGYRIELGEIETVLKEHEAVREAVVMVREDVPGDKRLVAYVVAAGQQVPSVSELRQHLKHTLPEYMVPGVFVMLDAFPLTPNRKIDRKALPLPEGLRPELQSAYVAPETELERTITAIWQEVLRLEKIGIHDNFFELGGYSLLATQVVSRIKKYLKVDVSLRSFFENPTIAGIAAKQALLAKRLKGELGPEIAAPLIKRRSGYDTLSLSFSQQRLWFLDQLEPESSLYNIPQAFRISGALQVEALQQTFETLVARHESLRTTFSVVDEHPVQCIAEQGSFALQVIDLMHLPEIERESEAQRLAAEEFRKPFDLAQDPLLRVSLLRLGATEHVLFLTLHHIIADGWSLGVLMQEMATLYDAFSKGISPSLPDLPIQYADFAVWQKEWLQGEVLAAQVTYWKEQLKGDLPLIALPTDHPRPAIQTYRGKRATRVLSKQLHDALNTLSRQEGVTLFMTLLAAFQVLFYRYTGQDDIIVGSPIANRNRLETEGLIGFFVNTLVLRTDLSGDPTFRELLAKVREVALEAYAHQDLPFEKLVEELGVPRDLSYNPLFQVMFVLQNAPLEPLQLAGLTVRPLEVETDTAKFDLTLELLEGVEGLTGSIEYNTDLFDSDTIERMLGHVETLLHGVVTNPEQHISAVPILTEAERHQLLVEWNNTTTDYPRDTCIHELFEAQVARTPDAVALVFEGTQLTYRELNARANQLAHYLRTLGVGPEVLIGICMERSLEMVVGLLGILKAGGAYVPLDPAYPKERLAFMMEDTRLSVLLTQQRLREALPEHSAQVFCLDTEWEIAAAENDQNMSAGSSGESLAYVMYTSGSTGTPKGVEVVHRGVVRLVMQTNYAVLNEKQMFLQLAPISFDASTFEVWAALLHGATCIVCTKDVPSTDTIADLIRRHSVSTLWLTASLFNAIVDEDPQALRGISQLLIGGEQLSASHVRRAQASLPGTHIINGYGPTENTTFTCCYPIPPALDPDTATIPIGRPIANTEVYILDRHLQLVPVGATGELYTGGDGLARGYLNRPELTAERFIPNPFSAAPGARLYRTGDLARYLPGGEIECLGRTDHQVKIRGFRIELGEVEAILAAYEAVGHVVVMAREDSPGDKRLVAYIVPAGEQSPSVSVLRQHVKEKLPEYMVPSTFVMLDKLPLTPNGKVDRRALPVPSGFRPELDSTYVAPQTEIEGAIAATWQAVLDLEKVGIHDNFFDLGGHSLRMAQVRSRLRQEFQINLPMLEFFKYPTVHSLARYLSQGKHQPIFSHENDDRMEKLTEGKNRLKRRAGSRRKETRIQDE